MERDGIETQKKPAGVRNVFKVKSVKKSGVNTQIGSRDLVLRNPNVNREERIRQLRDIRRRKDYFRLSRKKYITAKGEDESPNNVMSTQSIMQTGGVIRTAVGGTRNTAGRIQTAVNRGVSVSSVRDVGKMATVAKNATTGAVKESSRSLLQTKIDKSTTTDTGVEAAKQGLTELRYAENARRAIRNTAVGGIKTARSGRKTKQEAGRDVRKKREKIIRKHHAKRAAKSGGKVAGEAVKKGGGAVAKVVTSKGFIAVAAGAIVIIIFLNLISGFLSMILTAFSSMFSWLEPDRPWVERYKMMMNYFQQVEKAQADKQTELDGIFTYTAEYREDGSEITSLNQYGNTSLDLDLKAVLSAAAVVDYGKGKEKPSDETIYEVITAFYSYEHSTEKGFCPDADCKSETSELTAKNGDFYVSNTAYIAGSNEYAVTFRGTCYDHTSSVWTELTAATSDGEITGSCGAGVSGSDWEVTYNIGAEGFNKIDWNDITIKTTTAYCDNPDHTIYKGEVTIYDLETAVKNLGFDKDEESMFWTYYYALTEGQDA